MLKIFKNLYCLRCILSGGSWNEKGEKVEMLNESNRTKIESTNSPLDKQEESFHGFVLNI